MRRIKLVVKFEDLAISNSWSLIVSGGLVVAELNMCLVAVHPIKAPRAAGPPQRLSRAPSYVRLGGCHWRWIICALSIRLQYMDDTGSAQFSF